MNKKEAEIFIRKHMPLIIKDRNGNPQHPFKSVNAYEQVCKHLTDELVKSNSVLGDVVSFCLYTSNCGEKDDSIHVKIVLDADGTEGEILTKCSVKQFEMIDKILSYC